MGDRFAAIRLPNAYCLLPLGAIAQLGERVLCKHEVVGSIPSGSTRTRDVNRPSMMKRFAGRLAFQERVLGRLSGRAMTI